MKIQLPATCLFRDFPELCKMATIDAYQSALGSQLQPEHLVPTQAVELRLASKAR